MTDKLSREQRSKVMSSIPSRGNATTEGRLRAKLAAAGISGWHMNDASLDGKPDFVFPGWGLVVFVDGCFWHGCSRCRTIPKTHRKFWRNRIENNRMRDRKVNRKLRQKGWKVLRFWEHHLREDSTRVIADIRAASRGKND